MSKSFVKAQVCEEQGRHEQEQALKLSSQPSGRAALRQGISSSSRHQLFVKAAALRQDISNLLCVKCTKSKSKA
jgi:hypothetical protein